MDTQDSYQQVAQAYAENVRAIFTAPSAPTGERGGSGIASYDYLADQAEQLSPVSARLTEAAARELGALDADVRAQASTKLLAKALTDLQVSVYLLQAAEDEEAGIQPVADMGLERGVSRSDSVEEHLDILLGMSEAGAGAASRVERSGDRIPANIDVARMELTNSIQDTMTLISDRASKAGQAAFGGLLGLGAGEVARAAGMVGMDIAQALGQAEKVTRLYNLFRDLLVKAYDALLALVGGQVAKIAGEKVVEWVDQLKGGELFESLLKKLYDTKAIDDELSKVISSSQAPLEKFGAAIESVGKLDSTYQQQVSLAEKALKMLKFIGGLPAAVLPQAKLLLAAVNIVLGAYVILAGADMVDSQRLQILKRVPGVREVVLLNLTA